MPRIEFHATKNTNSPIADNSKNTHQIHFPKDQQEKIFLQEILFARRASEEQVSDALKASDTSIRYDLSPNKPNKFKQLQKKMIIL